MILYSESIKLKGISDPEQKNLNNVTWEVLEGTAVVSEDGVVSITENTTIGEDILVRASVRNPNFEKSFDDSVGYVNTEDEFLTDVIYLQNQYTMPLKSLTILEDGWEVACQSIALHVEPSPNVSDYSQVTWSVVNGEGSIDSNGVYSIDQSESGDPVTVKATSVVDSGISATATIYPKFSRRETTIYGEDEDLDININVFYNSGGTYADYYAYATPVFRANTSDTFDTHSSIDDNITWSVRVAYKFINGGWKNYDALDNNGNLIVSGEKPHFVDNRLILDPDATNPLQRVSIVATLNDSSGKTITSRGCTYDFEYNENIVPVEDIKLKTGVTLHNGVVTTNNTGTNGTIVFNASDRKDYSLVGLFEPTNSVYEDGVYKRESDGKIYNFDPNRIQFAHTDGNYHSELCTLHQTREVRAEYGVDGSEEWEASYPMYGEPYYGTREWNYDQFNTQLTKIYTVKNRICKKINAQIKGPDVPNKELISVKMTIMGQDMKTETYNSNNELVATQNETKLPLITATTAGMPIDNGKFTVKNQDGDPIFNSQSQIVTPIYTVKPTDGAYYYRINSLGYDLRIYDTDGAEKECTIETNVGGFKVIGYFKVKLL